MQAEAARATDVPEAQVAVASTGVIGVPLAHGRHPAAVLAARDALSPDGDAGFWRAIATTDAFEKRLSLDVALPSGRVRVSAQAKGAGMIAPGFATLLCFVSDRRRARAETADLLLGVCVKRSFERISVDGQLSTNDTAILMASGASGVTVAAGVRGRAAARRGARLRPAPAGGAHPARRRGRPPRRPRPRPRRARPTVERAARAVANSPLVKAALHGGDPNWGRIAQAVGAALPGTAPLPVDIWIEGVQVCGGGAALPHDATALAEAVAGDEVEYVVGLPGEGAETEVFFSDLSHEYVTINAEYTT